MHALAHLLGRFKRFVEHRVWDDGACGAALSQVQIEGLALSARHLTLESTHVGGGSRVCMEFAKEVRGASHELLLDLKGGNAT